MTRKIIFVGGIHGSGKSSFCKRISSSLELTHITASSLIGEHTKKQVENVPRNQETLINAIHSELSESQNYLLDGHFCLLTDSNQIEKIETHIFQRIGISGTIVIMSDADAIRNRLLERDGTSYPLSILTQLQKAEIDHANHVANQLNFPVYIASGMSNDNPAEDIRFIKDLL